MEWRRKFSSYLAVEGLMGVKVSEYFLGKWLGGPAEGGLGVKATFLSGYLMGCLLKKGFLSLSFIITSYLF
jgi:hypothetical protein